MYLDEWMTYKKVQNAELARAIGCDRSYVGLWRKKKRALTNVTWITKICGYLGITQQQLGKMPPKSHGKLGVSSEVVTDSEPTAGEADRSEDIEMIEQRTDLHAAIDDLPDHLIPTAQRLVERLKGLRGPKPSHPSKRGRPKA